MKLRLLFKDLISHWIMSSFRVFEQFEHQIEPWGGLISVHDLAIYPVAHVLAVPGTIAEIVR
jgi:hypothetical protein